MKHNKYWFKPKRFGWGFTPISWEGWIATAIVVIILLFIAYTNNFYTENITNKDITFFILELAIIIYFIIKIFKPRTQGEVKWNWGRRE